MRVREGLSSTSRPGRATARTVLRLGPWLSPAGGSEAPPSSTAWPSSGNRRERPLGCVSLDRKVGLNRLLSEYFIKFWFKVSKQDAEMMIRENPLRNEEDDKSDSELL